jgi:hypothetical protein
MKTLKQKLTPAQFRLLDRVIMANGLGDVITLKMLTAKEKKSFYKIREKGMYIKCEGDKNKIVLNVYKMINDADLMNYVASKREDVQAEKQARLDAASKEQSIVNLLMRKTGLTASAKYRGLTIFNAIFSFYNEVEKKLRHEESKKVARKERNKLIELSYELDHTKTYTYSLDVQDFKLD